MRNPSIRKQSNFGDVHVKLIRLLGAIPAVLLFIVLPVAAQMPAIRVACVGNSITIGYGLPDPNTAYPQQLGRLLGSGYDVKNFGVSGRTMLKKGDYPYWKEEFFKEALAFKPQIVTICLGTNDSKPWNWKYKSDFFGDYVDMIRAFRSVNPNVQVFVCFPPPVFDSRFGITDSIVHRQVVPLVDSVNEASGAYLIDFYDNMTGDSAYFFDGVHPDSAGDSIMARIVCDAIGSSPSGIIRNFSCGPYDMRTPGPVTLYWETTEGSAVTINGSAVKYSGSMVVSPESTTVYRLIAAGAVCDTSTVTIRVTEK